MIRLYAELAMSYEHQALSTFGEFTGKTGLRMAVGLVYLQKYLFY